MDRRETNHQWYSSFNEKDMCFIIEKGDGEEITIPAMYEVCGTCDGKGKHVNPSIDSHGLSREDFDDDPEFTEDYFSGRYDVPCNECHGKRVSPVVNYHNMPLAERKYIEDYIEEHYSYQRECDYERRMGC